MKQVQVFLLTLVIFAALLIPESQSMWATVFMNQSGKRNTKSLQEKVSNCRTPLLIKCVI